MAHTATRSRWARRSLGLLLGILSGACGRPPAPLAEPGHIVAQEGSDEPWFVIDAASGERISMVLGDAGSAQRLDRGVLYGVAGSALLGRRISDGAEVLRYHDEAALGPDLATDEQHLFTLADRQLLAVTKAGERLWAAPLPNEGRLQGPILAGGLVVAAAGDQVMAFDRHSGARAWTSRLKGPVRGLTAQTSALFAMGDDGGLVAIELADGRTRWTLELGADSAEPAWPEGRKLAASRDAVIAWKNGRMIALDPMTRALRWTGPAAEEAVFASTLAFVRLSDGRHGVVELEAGALRWARSLDAADCFGATLFAKEGIVVLRAGGELHAYELSDGRLRWRFDLDDGTVVPFEAAESE